MPARKTPGGYAPYLDGLYALNEGRWPDAARSFAQALEAQGDDPTFMLALGVAQVLAEQFPAGHKDLDRAQRPGLGGREAQLWISAAEAMSGSLIDPNHSLGGPGGQKDRPVVVSIPGHVAEGGSR